MASQIIECIPNFSEGRRSEVIAEIVAAIRAEGDIDVLDQSSDEDHNRTVITFAGSPRAVEAAAFRMISKAAELIDLEKHSGEHPRIGATDVVPFVPIQGVAMADCIEIAKRLGQRVADELNIPVYLYEEAAQRTERRNLEDIRKGEYEALKKEIADLPEREPDFGPQKLGRAGATVIGARHPLIAFNVYLDSDDVSIAKKIAKSVRHSSGGLRYVKALGLLVDGLAQISMNLTNYKKTSLARVVEHIRSEATRYGVNVLHSELVGLIPQRAMIDTAQWYLQLDMFQPDQVLETRLASTQSRDEIAASDFLSALAAGTPTPGGGSAAAYSGASGAALIAMVARLTSGNKKYASVQDQMEKILTTAEELRARLTTAILDDANAFNDVMSAYRMPKGDKAEKDARKLAIQDKTLVAAQIPLGVARDCAEVIELATKVADFGILSAISDAGAAAALARAGLIAAGLNVKINAKVLERKKMVDDLLNELDQLERQAEEHYGQVIRLLQERGGLQLE